MPNDAQMTLRLSQDLKSRLKTVAKTDDRSAHYVARKAVEEYVKDREWQAKNARIANERMEEYRRTGIAYTAEEVHERMEAYLAARRLPKSAE